MMGHMVLLQAQQLLWKVSSKLFLHVSDKKIMSSYRDSSAPGSHPQYGKLVGTSIDEVVIETDSGVRVHFPKIGYIVRKL